MLACDRRPRPGGAVVEIGAGRYIEGMSNLDTLLDRLKAHQRNLIMQAAQSDMLPPDGMLRQIADLENAIAAVEAVAGEAD